MEKLTLRFYDKFLVYLLRKMITENIYYTYHEQIDKDAAGGNDYYKPKKIDSLKVFKYEAALLNYKSIVIEVADSHR